MQQNVLSRDRAEDVGLCVRFVRLELYRGGGYVLAILQSRTIDAVELEQATEVEGSGESIDLLLGDVEFAHQQTQGDFVHVIRYFQPNWRTEPTAQEFPLEGLDQILRLVFFENHIFVSGNPELMVIENFHSGKKIGEVIGDEVFERDEPQQAAAIIRQLQKAGEHRRHLEAGELGAPDFGVTHPDRQVEGEAGDVGEWMRRIDRERHQHRKNARREDLVQRFTVGLAEVCPGFDMNSGVVQIRLHQLFECKGMTSLEHMHALLDRGEYIGCGVTDVGRNSEAGENTPLQPGNAHHEKFVEIAREDRKKIRPLQQRQFGVFGELQHPGIESQPTQLAIEIPVKGEGLVIRPDGLEIVVIETVGRKPSIADIRLTIHHNIIPLRSYAQYAEWG